MIEKRSIFSPEQTWLECMNCGHKTDLLQERKFRCPKCKGLYDVAHNLEKWKRPDAFKVLLDTFDRRFGAAACCSDPGPCFTSGVWRFKELIMPHLPEEYIVSLHEGNVPIVRAGKNLSQWIGGDIDLHIILEGMGPTGSFKDFGGTVMMSVAKAMGIKTIGCASTGDTSAMAAAYAAAAGIKSFVILPKGKVTAAQLAQPLVHGAKVINVPGSFDSCMAIMEKLVCNYGVFPANSLNPTRIEGHQATVFLIAQHFGWTLPDWISVPVGNGSNCSSVGKALWLLQSLGMDDAVKTKILGCQSKAANPLAESWQKVFSSCSEFSEVDPAEWKKYYKDKEVGETAATAARIGAPVSGAKVRREIFGSRGAMKTVTECNLNKAVAICGLDGYFVCPQTGLALAGVKDAVKNGWIKKGQKVVVVSTANGLKFTESAAAGLQKNIIELGDCRPQTAAKALGL